MDGDRPCPVCNSTESRPLAEYSPDPWRVVECGSCGFVFLLNPPGYAALVADYAWEKTSMEVRARRRAAHPLRTKVEKRLHRVGQFFRRDRKTEMVRLFRQGRILDIGCGNGQRLQSPLIPYGIELSRQLAAEADARMKAQGGECLHMPGAEGIERFEAGFFDGVLMHSYLEHESAVMRVMEGAFRVLKPGGTLFIRVPNFASVNRRLFGKDWPGFRYPDHVNYFTPASLRGLARKTGFSMRITNWWHLPLDDNIHALLTKREEATR